MFHARRRSAIPVQAPRLPDRAPTRPPARGPGHRRAPRSALRAGPQPAQARHVARQGRAGVQAGAGPGGGAGAGPPGGCRRAQRPATKDREAGTAARAWRDRDVPSPQRRGRAAQPQCHAATHSPPPGRAQGARRARVQTTGTHTLPSTRRFGISTADNYAIQTRERDAQTCRRTRESVTHIPRHIVPFMLVILHTHTSLYIFLISHAHIHTHTYTHTHIDASQKFSVTQPSAQTACRD